MAGRWGWRVHLILGWCNLKCMALSPENFVCVCVCVCVRVSHNSKHIKKSRCKGCNFLHITYKWSYQNFRKFRRFFDGPQSDYPFAGGDKNNEENQAVNPRNSDYIQVNALLYVTGVLNRQRNINCFWQVRLMWSLRDYSNPFVGYNPNQ